MLEKNFEELKDLGFSDLDLHMIEKLDNNLKVQAETLNEITNLLSGHAKIAEQIDWLACTFGGLVKSSKSKLEHTVAVLYSKHKDRLLADKASKALPQKTTESEVNREIIVDQIYIEMLKKKEISEKWHEYFRSMVFTMNQRENTLREASVNIRTIGNSNLD